LYTCPFLVHPRVSFLFAHVSFPGSAMYQFPVYPCILSWIVHVPFSRLPTCYAHAGPRGVSLWVHVFFSGRYTCHILHVHATQNYFVTEQQMIELFHK
jgi:hypothetical protein